MKLTLPSMPIRAKRTFRSGKSLEIRSKLHCNLMSLLNALEKRAKLPSRLINSQRGRSSRRFPSSLASLLAPSNLLKKNKKRNRALTKRKSLQTRKKKDKLLTLKISPNKPTRPSKTNTKFQKAKKHKKTTRSNKTREMRIQQEAKERSLISQRKRRMIPRKMMMKGLQRNRIRI